MQFIVKVRLLDGSVATVATIQVGASGSGVAGFLEVDGSPAQVTQTFENTDQLAANVADGGIEIIIINDDGI